MVEGRVRQLQWVGCNVVLDEVGSAVGLHGGFIGVDAALLAFSCGKDEGRA